MQRPKMSLEFRPSICLVRKIKKLRLLCQPDSVINTLLYNNACRYSLKMHPINEYVVDDERMDIETLIENTIVVRFYQLKNYFSRTL